MERPGFPFDPTHYQHHVPEIEKRIRDLDPHVIICGLGPSAWMLRLVDQELLSRYRIWGVNDFWKIRECDDLTIMDVPIRELIPGSVRHNWVKEARPKRWWFYRKCIHSWDNILPKDIVRHEFDLQLWGPGKKKGTPRLQQKPHSHTIASPVGTISIAWSEGLRRIGLIGVDLLDGQHRLSHHHEWLSWFVGQFADQAAKLNGLICNLSPFSNLKKLNPIPERKEASSV